MHILANITELVNCSAQHVAWNNIFHESLIKPMALHVLEDRTAVLIRSRMLERLYPIRCGPEARTPPLKLQDVSCRQRLQTDHPRGCTCTDVITGGLIVVSITRCFEANYPQAPSPNTGVGGALWRGTNGSTATPLPTRCRAMLEKHSSPHSRGLSREVGNCMRIRLQCRQRVDRKLGEMRAVQ